ncbi:hypothetical protein PMAYCL1PPCAC_17038, partial [Pristionchus mayeri]
TADLLTPVLFETMKAELPEYQNEIRNIKAIVVYEILKNGQQVATWSTDGASVPANCHFLENFIRFQPTVTVTVEDEIFVCLASGELDPIRTFMSGKIKARGNIMIMQKLQMVHRNALQRAKM